MANKPKQPPLLVREQFETILSILTDSERGKIFMAIMAYQWRSELPSDFTEKLSVVFHLLQAFIDEDNKKYEEKREDNRKKIQEYWDGRNSNK
ncbi:hypothetical protein M2480_002040 [Parabacteroides sp. PFB2-12]|uniref:DUF6291 domain-containing protein n=1 Tax=unclassified Parabacteroides TaxID=2649774 RepID=UPI00247361E7|nr:MULTISPECIES: DUF6291 domain-containing protein [unclassified Parabacteroides]MDH6342934.1 hypothetical protein [Parabacteroides sp. PM6-13]MDH6356256.1 hypothetical protein [Parabacteroides sp. PF5-9]MDH6391051.1 hypothetical protein [Parabacteroides sp. PFB2-12]